MPDKVDAGASSEIGVGNFIPTAAIGAPVHVAGLAGCRIDETLYYRDMPGVLLGYAALNEAEIREGVHALKNVLR